MIVKYRRIDLERFDYAVRMALSEREVTNAVVASRIDWITDTLVLEMHAFVFGEKLDIIEISHPADWWQATKERFFPKWALRRFPVEYKRYKYDVRAYYPKVSVPEHEHVVRLVKYEGLTVFGDDD